MTSSGLDLSYNFQPIIVIVNLQLWFNTKVILWKKKGRQKTRNVICGNFVNAYLHAYTVMWIQMYVKINFLLQVHYYLKEKYSLVLRIIPSHNGFVKWSLLLRTLICFHFTYINFKLHGMTVAANKTRIYWLIVICTNIPKYSVKLTLHLKEIRDYISFRQ